MSDINKFTTKEVLNKVLLDSSGNSVAANSHTSQEALNAVLDTSNNRLNVSLGGSNTISGDVTITGDLTVQGGGSLAFDEIIEGTSQVKVDNTSAFLVEKADGTDVFIVDTTNSNVKIPNGLLELGTADSTSGHINAFENMSFNIDTDNDDTNRFFEFSINGSSGAGTELMRLTEAGQLGIGATTIQQLLHLEKDDADVGIALTQSGQRSWSFGIDNSDSDRLKIGYSTTIGTNTVATFTESGQLGIGTGSDTIDAPLHVKGGTANTAKFQSASGATNISLTDSSDSLVGQIEFSASASQIVTRTSSTLSLGSNNVKTLHITDDDRVGIGTDSPTGAGLHINGSGNPGRLKIQQTSASDYSLVSYVTPSRQWNVGVGGASGASELQDNFFFQDVTGSVTSLILDVNSRISLSNNGGLNNTTFGYLALNSATANVANNVSIGHEALKAMDGTETGNVALGYQAMLSVDENVNSGGGTNSANFNIAIGHQALTGGQFSDANDSNNKDLVGNIAIGANALDATGTNAVVGAVAIGQSSLTAMTSGTGNTAVGYISGAAVTTGSYNTFIGDRSGDGTDDGNYNVALGYSSLSGNCGDSNTALGMNSLAVTTASSNTAVGYYAGNQISSGNSNVAVGKSAGQNLTTGSQNTVLGTNALPTADGGEGNNVAIGMSAMMNVNNDNADDNICIGVEAGKGGTGSLRRSIAIGTIALDATGSNDVEGAVAIGYGSLGALTSGAGNTAVGFEGGKDITTGANNTLLGYQAGQNILGGSNNIAIGTSSGETMTGVSSTVLVGKQAGQSINNADALGTVAIGHQSLKDLTSGVGNTAVGYLSLDAEDDGDRNTAIGYQALTNQTGTSGIVGNTALGYGAGDLITTGVQNVLLGSTTDPSANNGSNQVVIGYNATGQGDDTVVLGNSSVTDVYMAQDKGAKVHARNLALQDTASFQMAIEGYGTDVFAVMDLASAKGTIASPTDLSQADATMGRIRFLGYESSAFRVGAEIKGMTEGTWDGNTFNSRLSFFTTPNDNTGTATEKFRIADDGTLTGTDTDGIGSLSDERIKKNIKDYSGGLEIIKNLRPVTFEYKSSIRKQGTQRGFIAQEVKSVDNYFINEQRFAPDEEGNEHPEYQYTKDTDGVALTSKLTGGKDSMYVSAIKELLAKVETLESKVAELEKK